MKKIAFLAVAAALTVTVTVHAQEAEKPDPDKLFNEAITLIDEERYAEALPKLELAQQLDPGIGTQFNLAVCYAKTNKLALAWRNFVQVENAAKLAGKKEREASARKWLDEIKPKMPHAAVRVDHVGPVTVRIDGEVVAPFDLPFFPLEPGDHKLEAVAGGRRPFETPFVVETEKGVEIVVPALEPLAPTVEVRTVTEETTNTRRTLGFVLGGIGLLGAGTAAVTGIMILSDKSTADERCKPQCVTPTGETDTEGVDAVNRGKTLLPINVIAWVVAGVGLGARACRST